MLRLLVVASPSKEVAELCTALSRRDFACSTASSDDEVTGLIARQAPDLLLVEVNDRLADSSVWELVRELKREHSLPVIALVAGELSGDINGYLEVDDFLASPYNASELAVRVQRLLRNRQGVSSELIKCGSLVIDVTNCDVTVGGRVVELTFKEYELLKLLAANRGRVYTRQDLLNKVWGYDYYGGDRTVDVHVRRLRSKIEGPGDIFIETVRNIGYRFKKES